MRPRKRNILLGSILVLLVLLSVPGLYLVLKHFLFREPVLKMPPKADVKVLFLHHSTGKNIWDGGVPEHFKEHYKLSGKDYAIVEQAFPKSSPYGWHNYPYDHYNIWVKHAGKDPYMREPTLEMITEHYDVVVFKHCFPVSDILPDTGSPDINSPEKKLENYKPQYLALKQKLSEFPDTKFIVWTGAALVENSTSEGNAQRAKEFFDWVKNVWDDPGDNVFIWDLWTIETGGGIYMKEDKAVSGTDSHPNSEFSERAALLFFRRAIDVIEGRGDSGNITGE